LLLPLFMCRYPFTSHIDKKIFLTFLLKLYLYTFSLYENPSFIIKIPLSKIDRQHNGHKKKDKRTNNYLQNTTKKTKDRATRTPLKTRDQGRIQDFKLGGGGALKKIAMLKLGHCSESSVLCVVFQGPIVLCFFFSFGFYIAGTVYRY
jgi:hypothetical protein